MDVRSSWTYAFEGHSNPLYSLTLGLAPNSLLLGHLAPPRTVWSTGIALRAAMALDDLEAWNAWKLRSLVSAILGLYTLSYR